MGETREFLGTIYDAKKVRPVDGRDVLVRVKTKTLHGEQFRWRAGYASLGWTVYEFAGPYEITHWAEVPPL